MAKRFDILFLLCALLLLPGCFFTTGPNEIAVKVHKIGLFHARGVEEKIYEPGMTHFYIPMISEFHSFDTKLQNMEMAYDFNRGDVKKRDDLLFKTIDGNDISLDLIITYRINPEKAPMVLQQVATDDRELRQKLVRAVARSKPRDIFGELKTEQFYVSQSRNDKALRAKEVLNNILNPYGVIVERVSTKDYRFNPAYQKAIEDKKIADQQAEKNRAAAVASEAEWRKRLEDAQAEVNKMVAGADGRLKQAKIEADAYLEKKTQIAKAIEIEGINQARGIREMNKALAGPGGNVMVKLKIAEALKGKKILLLPSGGYNIKTMDMNSLLDVYGLQGVNEQAKKSEEPKKNKQATPKQKDVNPN